MDEPLVVGFIADGTLVGRNWEPIPLATSMNDAREWVSVCADGETQPWAVYKLVRVEPTD